MKLDGRILYLTEDPELLGAQLERQRPCDTIPSARSSTTSRPTSSRPAGFATTTTRRSRATAWSACAAARCSKDAIKDGGFGVIVSGISKGCGSARARRRRTASSRRACSSSSPRASRRSTGQNAQNIGLLTTHRLRPHRAHRARRGDPDRRVHARASIRSARRSSSTAGSSRTTARASPGEVAPPAITTRRAPDDALREDPRRARRSSTRRPASSASPR